MVCFKVGHISFKGICLGLVLCLLATTVFPPEALAEGVFALSAPAALVPTSPLFSPVLLKGLKVYPENPFKFDFIIDSGDTGLGAGDLKSESEKLIRYFLSSLAIPDSDLWVNLSPYEKDRIIPEVLGQTEMGRDMLAQDYILKCVTASLIYPEGSVGKEFWARVYKRSYEEYGTTDIPIDTFNKVWIIPEKAVVYEDADKAFVAHSRLKVMLESDYLASQVDREQYLVSSEEKNQPLDTSDQVPDAISIQIVRDVIVPELEREVNDGKNFAQLRQICHSLILAYWFKTKLKHSILNKVYTGKAKVKGIDTAERDMAQKIYGQYLETFRKGVYNILRVERDPYTNKPVPRKYFSGGELLVYNEGNTTFEDLRAHAARLPMDPSTTYQTTCEMKNSNDFPGHVSRMSSSVKMQLSAFSGGLRGVPWDKFMEYMNVVKATAQKKDAFAALFDQGEAGEKIRTAIRGAPQSTGQNTTLIKLQSATSASWGRELIDNAIDAILKKNHSSLVFGQFGQGSKQSFQELNDPLLRENGEYIGDYVMWSTSTEEDKGQKERRIIFYKGSNDDILVDFEEAQGTFSVGTTVDVRSRRFEAAEYQDLFLDGLKDAFEDSDQILIFLNGQAVNAGDDMETLDGESRRHDISEDQGRVEVDITAQGIRVRDNGTGIPYDVLAGKLPFKREGTNTEEFLQEMREDPQAKKTKISFSRDHVQQGQSKIVFVVGSRSLDKVLIPVPQGLSLPRKTVVRMPQISKVTNAKDKIEVNEEIQEAVSAITARLCEKIRASWLTDREKLTGQINALGQAAKYLQEHSVGTMIPFQKDFVAQVTGALKDVYEKDGHPKTLFVPAEFAILELEKANPGADIVYLDDMFFSRSTLLWGLGGGMMLSPQLSTQSARAYIALMPSAIPFIPFKGTVILNQGRVGELRDPRNIAYYNALMKSMGEPVSLGLEESDGQEFSGEDKKNVRDLKALLGKAYEFYVPQIFKHLKELHIEGPAIAFLAQLNQEALSGRPSQGRDALEAETKDGAKDQGPVRVDEIRLPPSASWHSGSRSGQSVMSVPQELIVLNNNSGAGYFVLYDLKADRVVFDSQEFVEKIQKDPRLKKIFGTKKDVAFRLGQEQFLSSKYRGVWQLFDYTLLKNQGSGSLSSKEKEKKTFPGGLADTWRAVRQFIVSMGLTGAASWGLVMLSQLALHFAGIPGSDLQEYIQLKSLETVIPLWDPVVGDVDMPVNIPYPAFNFGYLPHWDPVLYFIVPLALFTFQTIWRINGFLSRSVRQRQIATFALASMFTSLVLSFLNTLSGPHAFFPGAVEGFQDYYLSLIRTNVVFVFGIAVSFFAWLLSEGSLWNAYQKPYGIIQEEFFRSIPPEYRDKIDLLLRNTSDAFNAKTLIINGKGRSAKEIKETIRDADGVLYQVTDWLSFDSWRPRREKVYRPLGPTEGTRLRFSLPSSEKIVNFYKNAKNQVVVLSEKKTRGKQKKYAVRIFQGGHTQPYQFCKGYWYEAKPFWQTEFTNNDSGFPIYLSRAFDSMFLNTDYDWPDLDGAFDGAIGARLASAEKIRDLGIYFRAEHAVSVSQRFAVVMGPQRDLRLVDKESLEAMDTVALPPGYSFAPRSPEPFYAWEEGGAYKIAVILKKDAIPNERFDGKLYRVVLTLKDRGQKEPDPGKEEEGVAAVQMSQDAEGLKADRFKKNLASQTQEFFKVFVTSETLDALSSIDFDIFAAMTQAAQEALKGALSGPQALGEQRRDVFLKLFELTGFLLKRQDPQELEAFIRKWIAVCQNEDLAEARKFLARLESQMQKQGKLTAEEVETESFWVGLTNDEQAPIRDRKSLLDHAAPVEASIHNVPVSEVLWYRLYLWARGQRLRLTDDLAHRIDEAKDNAQVKDTSHFDQNLSVAIRSQDVKTMIRELIQNARDACRDAARRAKDAAIDIRLYATEEAQGRWSLATEVQDAGIGMNDDILLNALLVLDNTTKPLHFGQGFFTIFGATNPGDRVEIETTKGDGIGYRLTIEVRAEGRGRRLDVKDLQQVKVPPGNSGTMVRQIRHFDSKAKADRVFKHMKTLCKYYGGHVQDVRITVNDEVINKDIAHNVGIGLVAGDRQAPMTIGNVDGAKKEISSGIVITHNSLPMGSPDDYLVCLPASAIKFMQEKSAVIDLPDFVELNMDRQGVGHPENKDAVRVAVGWAAMAWLAQHLEEIKERHPSLWGEVDRALKEIEKGSGNESVTAPSGKGRSDYGKKSQKQIRDNWYQLLVRTKMFARPGQQTRISLFDLYWDKESQGRPAPEYVSVDPKQLEVRLPVAPRVTKTLFGDSANAPSSSQGPRRLKLDWGVFRRPQSLIGAGAIIILFFGLNFLILNEAKKEKEEMVRDAIEIRKQQEADSIAEAEAKKNKVVTITINDEEIGEGEDIFFGEVDVIVVGGGSSDGFGSGFKIGNGKNKTLDRNPPEGASKVFAHTNNFKDGEYALKGFHVGLETQFYIRASEMLPSGEGLRDTAVLVYKIPQGSTKEYPLYQIVEGPTVKFKISGDESGIAIRDDGVIEGREPREDSYVVQMIERHNGPNRLIIPADLEKKIADGLQREFSDIPQEWKDHLEAYRNKPRPAGMSEEKWIKEREQAVQRLMEKYFAYDDTKAFVPGQSWMSLANDLYLSQGKSIHCKCHELSLYKFLLMRYVGIRALIGDIVMNKFNEKGEGFLANNNLHKDTYMLFPDNTIQDASWAGVPTFQSKGDYSTKKLSVDEGAKGLMGETKQKPNELKLGSGSGFGQGGTGQDGSCQGGSCQGGSGQGGTGQGGKSSGTSPEGKPGDGSGSGSSQGGSGQGDVGKGGVPIVSEDGKPIVSEDGKPVTWKDPGSQEPSPESKKGQAQEIKNEARSNFWWVLGGALASVVSIFLVRVSQKKKKAKEDSAPQDKPVSDKTDKSPLSRKAIAEDIIAPEGLNFNGGNGNGAGQEQGLSDQEARKHQALKDHFPQIEDFIRTFFAKSSRVEEVVANQEKLVFFFKAPGQEKARKFKLSVDLITDDGLVNEKALQENLLSFVSPREDDLSSRLKFIQDMIPGSGGAQDKDLKSFLPENFISSNVLSRSDVDRATQGIVAALNVSMAIPGNPFLFLEAKDRTWSGDAAWTSSLDGNPKDFVFVADHTLPVGSPSAGSQPERSVTGMKNPGGIDLNPQNMDFQTQGQSLDFVLPAEWQGVDLESIPGFVPIIINITPVANFNAFLGLNQKDADNETLALNNP